MSNEWFDELGRIFSLLPKYEDAYTGLGRLYLRLLDEATRNSGIHLAGCFSKTDYLLKQKNAPPVLRRVVNDMRLRLTTDTQAQCEENFIIDFQALCHFIALLYDASIPKAFCEKFVGQDIVEKAGRKDKFPYEYVRVVVDSWDEEFIHATSELSLDPCSIKYSGTNQLYDNDNSYLSALLYKGMMLNIISPHKSGNGTILPEFIIVEPDYLVDVSTIASCFEPHAVSPLSAIPRRLQPSVISDSILLGNMASELLDTVLHIDDSQMTPAKLSEHYRVAANNFFRKNSVALIAHAPEGRFHEQAWQQMLNMYHALLHTMPTQLEHYQRDNVIVEPTFFSEMLGLQGRMDMLQTDMRILVEQKSGNAAFTPRASDADVPRHKEQHYIQMLLYMAIIRYNYRQVYEGNNSELYSFLLYSKYKCPLVGLGFAPKLLFNALKLRNLYVGQENSLCHGGISMLMNLSPEDFNETGTDSNLWHKYQRPRIEAFLSVVQEASELERLYFQRFYTFVALEHKLSKVGSQTKEASGFASAWLSPLDEKLQCGTILTDLEISHSSDPVISGITDVVLRYHGETGNLRQGDIVALYSYDITQTPDIRKSIVYRGTITSISHSDIVVKLRTPQSNVHVFDLCKGRAWCLEHDFMESSYSGLYKGLYSFLCAPRERKDLILARRLPRLASDPDVKGNYGDFNTLQYRIKKAQELFLLIGPPGTGKTSFGMLDTVKEELHEENSKILIVSFTNRSVDEICSKLYPSIDYIRVGGSALSSEQYADKDLSAVLSKCKNATELRDRFMSTRVVVGTTASVAAHLSLLSMCHFSLCVVDEASQILEPHLLPLLALCGADGKPSISKFVMIGDHKQLPAVVQQRTKESCVNEPMLREIGLTDCRSSLFERLLLKHRGNPDVCYMLTRQGRMHPDIALFPNVSFYGGKLEEVPLPHQLKESSSPRVRFIDVLPASDSLTDKVNANEASVIVDELLDIWNHNKADFSPTETVGVIVPYRNQISAIRSALAGRLHDAEHPLMHITIDTVERFQGSQRRYVIYGFTVQKAYQLRFLTETTFEEDGMIIDRKLNVAMTRAQEYLVMVGNSALLRKVLLYNKLLEFIGNTSRA